MMTCLCLKRHTNFSKRHRHTSEVAHLDNKAPKSRPPSEAITAVIDTMEKEKEALQRRIDAKKKEAEKRIEEEQRKMRMDEDRKKMVREMERSMQERIKREERERGKKGG